MAELEEASAVQHERETLISQAGGNDAVKSFNCKINGTSDVFTVAISLSRKNYPVSLKCIILNNRFDSIHSGRGQNSFLKIYMF